MGRFANFLAAVAVTALTPFAVSAITLNDMVTPDVFFGTNNVNGSFAISTLGGVELGLRAKLRFDDTTGCPGGAGCPQNIFNYDNDDTYTFASADSNPLPGWSIFNFEWSINTLGGAMLDSLTYKIFIDTDPTVNDNMAGFYDPLGAGSTGYYLGTDSSGNGGTPFTAPGSGNLSMFNVAQNSVNMGFLPGSNIGSGQFTFTLAAFTGLTQVNATTINVIVDAPAPVPLPAGGLLLIGALGGLAALRRRAKRA